MCQLNLAKFVRKRVRLKVLLASRSASRSGCISLLLPAFVCLSLLLGRVRLTTTRTNMQSCDALEGHFVFARSVCSFIITANNISALASLSGREAPSGRDPVSCDTIGLTLGADAAPCVTVNYRLQEVRTVWLLFLTLFVVDLLELFVVVSRHFFSSGQIADG